MRLPRRVPWEQITEVEQVCSWIFVDESDLPAKQLAIRRIAAWGHSTALPHAVESTAGLLVVIYEDALASQVPGLYLRQSYASALIRLVNGLVDPLQLGAYARSIASIASQLGLPLWLVELRHAATHEDLPSLELLREGARQAMSWLLHNYWLPTISPSSRIPSQARPLRPLEPLLKQYKVLMKLTTRDASLRSRHKEELSAILRDVERWISEAQVAAQPDVDWDNSDSDAKERWALELLCDSLLQKGALVPLSKKKRIFPPEAFMPPVFSDQLWSPLLDSISDLHHDFLFVLASKIVSRLASEEVDEAQKDLDTLPLVTDLSFDACLARWVMWFVRRMPDMKTDILSSVITVLGPSPKQTGGTSAITELLEALTVGDPDMQATMSLLVPSQSQRSLSAWTPDAIPTMQHRLSVLLGSGVKQGDRISQSSLPSGALENVVPGWRFLDGNSAWKPCPIGVHSVVL